MNYLKVTLLYDIDGELIRAWVGLYSILEAYAWVNNHPTYTLEDIYLFYTNMTRIELCELVENN